MPCNGLFARSVASSAAAQVFVKTLYKTPIVVWHGVRCGKATCRCRGRNFHGPYAFLYWRDERGRQRRRYVRQADVAAVEAIVAKRLAADREERLQAAHAKVELRQLRRWLRDLERGGTT